MRLRDDQVVAAFIIACLQARGERRAIPALRNGLAEQIQYCCSNVNLVMEGIALACV